ncbi:MAG: hypothetical protein IJQ58_01785 [Synergistaceae bacterium]|nr:hypothetical protein [Synergistaceae bacterium]
MKHIKLSAVMIVIAAIFVFAPSSESSIPLHTDSNRNPSSLPEFIRPQKNTSPKRRSNPNAESATRNYSHPSVKNNIIPGAEVISWELASLAENILNSRRPDFTGRINLSLNEGVSAEMESIVCSDRMTITAGTGNARYRGMRIDDDDEGYEGFMIITADPSHEFGARINAGSYSSKIRPGANMRLSKSYLTEYVSSSSIEDNPGHLRVILSHCVLDFLYDGETITQISCCVRPPKNVINNPGIESTMNFARRKATEMGLACPY